VELPEILSLAAVSFLGEATLADLRKAAVSPKAGRCLGECRISEDEELLGN
jgi:hypothetical protein